MSRRRKKLTFKILYCRKFFFFLHIWAQAQEKKDFKPCQERGDAVLEGTFCERGIGFLIYWEVN